MATLSSASTFGSPSPDEETAIGPMSLPSCICSNVTDLAS
ncbi:hypothetical protein MnTg01_01037 [archaeon MnTg01]|nr:hypothetical protein MnTg01_01037 [archaeon MnTg01]